MQQNSAVALVPLSKSKPHLPDNSWPARSPPFSNLQKMPTWLGLGVPSVLFVDGIQGEGELGGDEVAVDEGKGAFPVHLLVGSVPTLIDLAEVA